MNFWLSLPGLLIALGIWMLASIFVYCAKRKFGNCEKCPHLGKKTIYPRKCYYESQCILGWSPVVARFWRTKNEINKNKDKNSKGL